MFFYDFQVYAIHTKKKQTFINGLEGVKTVQVILIEINKLIRDNLFFLNFFKVNSVQETCPNALRFTYQNLKSSKSHEKMKQRTSDL